MRSYPRSLQSFTAFVLGGCTLTDLSKDVVNPFNKRQVKEVHTNSYRCQNCNLSTKTLPLTRPHTESFCGKCCDDTEWILQEIQDFNDNNFTTEDSTFSNESKVKLEVGGRLFRTTVGILTSESSPSLFTSLFSNTYSVHDPSSATIKIDRSPKWFQQVIDFCRQGTLSPLYSTRDLLEIEEDAKYYGLDRLMDYCRKNRQQRVRTGEDSRELSCEFSQILESQKEVHSRLAQLSQSPTTDESYIIRMIETLQGSVSEASHLVSFFNNSKHQSQNEECQIFIDECNSLAVEQNSITDKLEYLNESVTLSSSDRVLTHEQRGSAIQILTNLQMSLVHAIRLLEGPSEGLSLRELSHYNNPPTSERTLRDVLSEGVEFIEDCNFIPTDEKSASTGFQPTQIHHRSEELVLSGIGHQYHEHHSLGSMISDGEVKAVEEVNQRKRQPWSSVMNNEVEQSDSVENIISSSNLDQRQLQAMTLITSQLETQSSDINFIKQALSRQFFGVGALIGLTIVYRLIK